MPQSNNQSPSLIIVAVLVIIAFLLLLYATRPEPIPKTHLNESIARGEMMLVGKGVDMYQTIYGVYPSEEQGLHGQRVSPFFLKYRIDVMMGKR